MGKFTIKKYEGDDQYSYAVFRKRDVANKGSVIFWGDANPIVCGLSRTEAQSHKRSLEKRTKED